MLLVPARQSPLKSTVAAPAHHRVAMALLAAAENPLFRVSTVDVDRPGPSYTVDTVRMLGAQYPGAELYLILGMDALLDILNWRDPLALLDCCHIVGVARPGLPLVVPERIKAALGERSARIMLQETPQLDISATELRRRIAAGEPVRYLLPEPVRLYIGEHGLYRTR